MAFLNTPMADVWKATKRTFTDFMDVDGPNRPSTGESPNVRPNVIVKANRPSAKVKQERGTDDHVRRIGTGEHRFTSNQHQKRDRLRNASEPRTVVQTTVGSAYPNIQTQRESPQNLPRNVNESRPKGQFSTSTSNIRLKRMSPSPSSSTSKPNVTVNSSTHVSSKLKPKDSDDTYLNRSQTEPELGLYPQFATFQPREPTVSRDAPLCMSGTDSLDFEEHSHLVSQKKNNLSPHFLTIDRPSRTRGQKQRQRYRSSSSDRAAEAKGLQRRPSYNKSNTIDVRSDEDDDDWLEQAEKVKLRFMSMWNNVKYGWTVKTKTPFNIHKAIWLLGKCYHHKPEDPDLDKIHPGLNNVRSPAMELFKQDFVSRIWLTYRREFPQLSGSTLTTDCGWGCMLRSGQMLLAQALILHFLGRDWNLYKSQTVESERLHRQIIQWFGDQPSDMSPFSLHHLVEIGKRGGKRAGDWFGPASVAHIVKEAVDRAPELNPLLDNVCIYVSQDCTVYKQDVIDLCTRKRKKSLKPFFHDVPERTSSQDGSTGRRSTSSGVLENEHIKETNPSVSRLQTDKYENTPTSYPGNKNANTVNMCNKKTLSSNGKVEDEKDDGRMKEDASEMNVMDESFAAVLDKFRSEFEGYSSDRKTSPCGETVNDKRDENIHVSGRGNVNGTESLNGNIHSDNALCSETGAISSKNRTVENKSPDCDVSKIPLPRDDISESPSLSMPSNKNPDRTVKSTDEDVFIDEDKRLGKGSNEARKNAGIQEHGVKEEEPIHPTHTNNSNSPTEELSSDWCAVIILVPVRLGGEEVNGIYIRPIQSLFSMTNCIGIIGGKPRHSLYFVGFQDEKLIHLDPHYCQSVVDMREKDFPIWSFHCMSPRKMSITKMDPSCTIGFYLPTRDDFEKFCVEIQQVINPPGNGKDYPMFIIREGRCQEWNAQHDLSSKNERYLRVRHVNEDGTLIAPVTASEDFVLLD